MGKSPGNPWQLGHKSHVFLAVERVITHTQKPALSTWLPFSGAGPFPQPCAHRGLLAELYQPSIGIRHSEGELPNLCHLKKWHGLSLRHLGDTHLKWASTGLRTPWVWRKGLMTTQGGAALRVRRYSNSHAKSSMLQENFGQSGGSLVP